MKNIIGLLIIVSTLFSCEKPSSTNNCFLKKMEMKDPSNHVVVVKYELKNDGSKYTGATLIKGDSIIRITQKIIATAYVNVRRIS